MSPGELDATEDAPVTGRRGWGLLWRSLPLILGLIAFELTANPMLGIVVTCSKLGWEEFQTAAWLLRNDPAWSRGLACAGLFAAFGFVKTCVAGVVALLAALLVSAWLGRKQGLDPLGHQTIGALVALAGGGVAFVLVTILAITTALWRGVKVWVGPEAHRARRSRDCPPQSSGPKGPGENVAAAVLKGIYILSGFGLFVVVMRLIAGGPWLLKPPAAIVVFVVSLFSSMAVSGWVFQRIGARILAASPQDCWPPPGAK